MSAAKPGLIGRLFKAVKDTALRREQVGVDAYGNIYYRKWEKNISGDIVERRWFETPSGGGYTSYNPDATTPQWRQWLSRSRQDPPTPEELQAEVARKAQMQVRVAAIKAEEAKRRLQAELAGEESEAAAGPVLNRFVGQLTGRGYAAGESSGMPESSAQQPQASTPQRSGQRQAAAAPKQDKPTKSGKLDFEPEAWKPGGG